MVRLLHEFLDDSIKNLPNKTAIVCGNESITYLELDKRCNKYVQLFLSLGVKKGDHIGLFTNKNIDSVICMIAILRMGAVFVPINNNMTMEDISYVITDCDIHILVGDELVYKIVQSQCKIECLEKIVLTSDIQYVRYSYYEIISVQGYEVDVTKTLNVKVISSDLAYIYYTSGSTGRPKGVMITHGSVVFVIQFRRKFLEFDSNFVLVSLAPQYFDPFLNEIFCTLSAGGKLILINNNNNSLLLYKNFLNVIKNNEVNGFFCVPSFLNMLAYDLQKISLGLKHLKFIVFGAGISSVKIVEKLKNIMPNTNFIHGYGLTETSIAACSYRVTSAADFLRDALPLGEPFPDTEFYILDENNKQVSNGVGELVIRGPHLMNGYWNNPEETSKVLRPNPLYPEHNERVLYTGDLVKVETDGKLFFVGRKDDQIKSAGHRIELGDIEGRISFFEGVHEICLVPVLDCEMGYKIKCFVTLEKGFTLESLQEYCRKNIPTYAIPHIWKVMSTIPKNANGKINKRLLKQQTLIKENSEVE